MSVLSSRHMVDKVILRRYVEEDKFGKRIFEEPVEIPCRIVNKTEIIKLTDTEKIVSNQVIYTLEKVSKLDNVNGLDILDLYEYNSLYSHDVQGYRVKI